MPARVWWRYLGAFVATTATLLTVSWLVIEKHQREHGPTIPYQVLFAHQVEKLEGPTPSTLFLGDSSLGNSISAAHWEALSQRSAANLALTGSYGYAGSYNFLRRALARGRPDNVVIMHTADMPARPVNEAAFELTKPEGSAWQRLQKYWLESMNLTQLGVAFGTLLRSEQNARAARPGAAALRDDYIAQVAHPVAPAKQGRKLNHRGIKRANLEYLHQLAALCKREGINCIYAHGPLAHASCQASKDYLVTASRAIGKTGLPLASDRPLCLAADEVGDEIDHVRPGLKQDTTERYYALLKPLLR